MTDPLSDVLALLRPRRQAAGAIDFGGEWAVEIPAGPGMRCYAIGRGECWIEVEGLGEPRCLLADDCILLAAGRSFRIGSARNGKPLTQSDPTPFERDRVSTVNGGGACLVIGGHFMLDAAHARLLSGALPPMSVVRDEGQREDLRSALKGLWRELEAPRPGGRLLLEHFSQLMLIFTLRLGVGGDAYRPTGWLGALADGRISKALSAVHTFPQRRWTLGALAAEAGVSRTVFAERFRALVDATLMTYLHRWRMAVAAYRLSEEEAPVGEVAIAVGYASGTSFSTAFRKEFGVAPRDYATSSRRSALASYPFTAHRLQVADPSGEPT